MVFMEWRLYRGEVVVVSGQDVPTVQASCLCNLYIVKTATGQHNAQNRKFSTSKLTKCENP